jgi:hypothetical protein
MRVAEVEGGGGRGGCGWCNLILFVTLGALEPATVNLVTDADNGALDKLAHCKVAIE